MLSYAEWQQARLNDPRNPVDPAYADRTDHQKHRRTYCEVCLLLWDKKCQDSLEVHHGIPRDIFQSYDLFELDTDPRILFTLCDSGVKTHQWLGHLGSYQNSNVRLAHMMKHMWEMKYEKKEQER